MEDLLREPPGLLGSALLLADIDHFKVVNDTYGHVLGDKVIRAVAHVLRSSIKGRDVAARLGGEEFAILLPQTSLTGAAAVAEQIRGTVAQGRICRPDGNESIGQVTLSVGVAVAKPGDTLEALLERADAAMYTAKRAGRNRISVATDTAPRPLPLHFKASAALMSASPSASSRGYSTPSGTSRGRRHRRRRVAPVAF